MRRRGREYVRRHWSRARAFARAAAAVLADVVARSVSRTRAGRGARVTRPARGARRRICGKSSGTAWTSCPSCCCSGSLEPGPPRRGRHRAVPAAGAAAHSFTMGRTRRAARHRRSAGQPVLGLSALAARADDRLRSVSHRRSQLRASDGRSARRAHVVMCHDVDAFEAALPGADRARRCPARMGRRLLDGPPPRGARGVRQSRATRDALVDAGLVRRVARRRRAVRRAPDVLAARPTSWPMRRRRGCSARPIRRRTRDPARRQHRCRASGSTSCSTCSPRCGAATRERG